VWFSFVDRRYDVHNLTIWAKRSQNDEIAARASLESVAVVSRLARSPGDSMGWVF
jgi:hypothetical protein